MLFRSGVRRYGFHGLSYQYIIGELLQHSQRGQGRVLMAHLGNGASLCAALEGESIASTMGFSALDGLMMGTRSGTLDPGVLLYLMEQGWDRRRIEQLLYKESGLLGVSGLSADMRTLRTDSSAAARRATDLFAHRVVRECGAMLACGYQPEQMRLHPLAREDRTLMLKAYVRDLWGRFLNRLKPNPRTSPRRRST